MYRGRQRGNQPSYPRRVYNQRMPQRDLEDELLMLITSEYQVHCTEVRPFDEIYERLRQNQELHSYVHCSEDSFRQFLQNYSEYFYFDPPGSNVLRWSKLRVVSKRDPKEKSRRERREWAKKFEETMVSYDICLEQNVLSLIVYLFDLANDFFIPTELLEKTVRLAFQNEVDLQDYLGKDVRSFVMRRNHIFGENVEWLHFYGKSQYTIFFELNAFIRSNVGGQNRETISRVYDNYLNNPIITNEMRNELRIQDRKQFIDFLSRATFLLDVSETHVTSKRDMPRLTLDRRSFSYCNFVLGDFKQAVRRDSDSDDERKSRGGGGGRAATGRPSRPDSSPAPPDAPEGNNGGRAASSLVSSAVPAGGLVVENPFEKRRVAAAAAAAALEQQQQQMTDEMLSTPLDRLNLAVTGRRGRGVSQLQRETFLRGPGN